MGLKRAKVRLLMIKVRDLSLERCGFEILRRISLEALAGESVALLGHNGAGKTTLIKTIAGLINPEVGVVSTEGIVGYVPDEKGFYSCMTLQDNVTFRARLAGLPKGEAADEVDRLLEQFGLIACREQAASSLSQGMAKRLAICCALAMRPDIILLDEPMNGLDPIANEKMGDAIRSWAQEGKTVLVSSHDLHSVVCSCDKAYILNKGVVAWSGLVPQDYEKLRDLYFKYAGENTSR